MSFFDRWRPTAVKFRSGGVVAPKPPCESCNAVHERMPGSCPFCGGDWLRLYGAGEPLIFRVCCMSCRAEGPHGPVGTAAGLWNKRRPLKPFSCEETP